jgi:hypothetical protein
MVWQKLFGEKATTKIAVVFKTEAEAIDAARSLKEVADLQSTQVQFIAPYEKQFGRKIEPEVQGILRTAVRSHLVLGVAGLILGFLVWLALYTQGWPTIRTTPVMSAVALLFFSTAGGMMLGGLITARPDHQMVIQRIRTASEAGEWSVVIHPRDPEQCDIVMAYLSSEEADVTRTV